MLNSLPETVRLKKVGSEWRFQSEANLEEFFYLNLDKILEFSTFNRQFSVAGQFCDILALGADKSLIIIELKNEEDRYVVSQISRYYDAIAEEKPFFEIVDYSKPIKLVVIAPTFHRDNLIDRKYSRLDIDFFRFELSVATQSFTFTLYDLDKKKRSSISFLHGMNLENSSISAPPRKLLNWVSELQAPEQRAILGIREKILGFHSGMKEISSNSSILYGSNKTKTCAEFRYDETRKTVALFLWLPHVTSNSVTAKKIVARMRLWTDWDVVTAMGHVPKGSGRKISLEEWKTASVKPLKKLLPRSSWSDSSERYFTDQDYRERYVERHKALAMMPHYKTGLAMPIDRYLKLTNNREDLTSLDGLVKLALDIWLKKS